MKKYNMKRYICILSIALMALHLFTLKVNAQDMSFLRVDGKNVVDAKGNPFYIQGTNLGNWLNPEGYMFGFKKTISAFMIDQMFRELVGDKATDDFWQNFKSNYVTVGDINYLASLGVNTIRLPLNYKLFTDEDYLGRNAAQDGFRIIDKIVRWCKAKHIYVILDMHSAPGGQTGGNVDNSYGYPWLFADNHYEQQLMTIWEQIASRYQDEPCILGYELLNEPIEYRPVITDGIPTNDWNKYYDDLEPMYKRLVAGIRKVDKKHIIILGGARGNTDFLMFTDWKFDNNIMYSCHCYSATTRVTPYVQFRDRTGLPMFVGETGHLEYQVQNEMTQLFKDNNLGYTYWPYKKYGKGGSFVWFTPSAEWQKVIEFADTERGTYQAIKKARPDQATSLKAMKSFVTNCLYDNCTKDANYIATVGLK